MNRRILCVDDEPNILQGYQRALRKHYNITVAESGAEGLDLLATSEPFAVVVSDMRMPGMDGIQFLARVKELFPNSVRMMLTGNVDQQTAINAVNQGSIFRFLNKPCTAEDLNRALTAGVEQYRLIMAEKELLEGTLNQSLQVMVDLLSLVSPLAFSRTVRVKRLAREIATRLGAPNLWEIEISAMLSQIGLIMIPKKVLRKINDDKLLTPAEQSLYENHPQVAQKLIARIPRLQTAAAIIAHKDDLFQAPSPSINETSEPDVVRCSAQIIKVAQDFDQLLFGGCTPMEAWQTMSQREGWYIPTILDTLKSVIGEDADEEIERKLSLTQLKPGMTLCQSLYTKNGEQLMASGAEINMPIIMRLQELAEEGEIEPEVLVLTPLSLLPKTQATSV